MVCVSTHMHVHEVFSVRSDITFWTTCTYVYAYMYVYTYVRNFYGYIYVYVISPNNIALSESLTAYPMLEVCSHWLAQVTTGEIR